LDAAKTGLTEAVDSNSQACALAAQLGDDRSLLLTDDAATW